MTLSIIWKDVYLSGRCYHWLIVINLTNINKEQYNYYNGSSISHAHIVSTITYPHFNPINTLSIFHSITNRNMKISISLLHKHLQKFQHYNYYQLFIIHLHKYLLITSYIHYINLSYLVINKIYCMSYIKLF